jgi:predicted AlkP superfamily phosphohydrolase/phosphomutase
MDTSEQLMDNLLNVDLEIIDVVRELHQSNWDSTSMKQQVGDLLKIRDEMVKELMSLKDDDHSCDCEHDHAHE